MKTLILMRHAKSAWDVTGTKDIDRPLNARGRKAAPRMGEWLKAQKYRPDVVLCSTAARARETLELVKLSLPGGAAIEYQRGLYMAEPRDLLREIGKAPASAGTLLLIGHNPGLEILAGQLAGKGEAKTLDALHRKLPTAGVAVIRFKAAQWSELAPGAGELVAFQRPRDLE